MSNNTDYNTTYIQKPGMTRTLLIGAVVTTIAMSSPLNYKSECLSSNSMEMALYEKNNYHYNSSIQLSGNEIQNSFNRVDHFAESIFGKMRNATNDEKDYVYNYMIKTSRKTGVNIFDLC